MLEEKHSKGHRLDSQQIAKLQTKSVLECCLADLGIPIEELSEKPSASESTEGKGKYIGTSRKQKKKGKKQPLQVDYLSGGCHEEDKPTPGGKCQEVEVTMDCYNVGFLPLAKDEIAGSEEKPFSDVKKESWNDEKVISREAGKGKSANAPGKKKSKKGGLSMFLSGALDDVPKEAAPPPPLPKSKGPAWGGAKLPKGSTSLREILDEQKTNKDVSPIMGGRAKEGEVADANKSEGRMNLSLLVPSSPIAVRQPPQSSHGLDAERGTPPWASSGTPPLGSRPSLRDIQQQQQGKQQLALSPSPKTRTSGFAITSGQGSPTDPAGMNRWFKPEAEATSSIRAIQIEEKAMKDLKRFYSSVKIVKSNNNYH
ncbi:hypothetical protein MLD38_004557 [Melastoma candidum]|uniref:Uncharacterized protein n=1 Tax=Melastoma candidum TaxID=119954 RepID=A0ACB9S5A4_9MYRT|nr:hypothetical protein MLD38_004557 [Melastoma candidum]